MKKIICCLVLVFLHDVQSSQKQYEQYNQVISNSSPELKKMLATLEKVIMVKKEMKKAEEELKIAHEPACKEPDDPFCKCYNGGVVCESRGSGEPESNKILRWDPNLIPKRLVPKLVRDKIAVLEKAVEPDCIEPDDPYCKCHNGAFVCESRVELNEPTACIEPDDPYCKCHNGGVVCESRVELNEPTECHTDDPCWCSNGRLKCSSITEPEEPELDQIEIADLPECHTDDPYCKCYKGRLMCYSITEPEEPEDSKECQTDLPCWCSNGRLKCDRYIAEPEEPEVVQIEKPASVCKDHHGNPKQHGDTWTEPGCMQAECTMPMGNDILRGCYLNDPQLCRSSEKLVDITDKNAPYPECCPQSKCVPDPDKGKGVKTCDGDNPCIGVGTYCEDNLCQCLFNEYLDDYGMCVPRLIVCKDHHGNPKQHGDTWTEPGCMQAGCTMPVGKDILRGCYEILPQLCRSSEKSVEITDKNAPYPECCPQFKCVPDPDKVCKDHLGNKRQDGEKWLEPGCVMGGCDYFWGGRFTYKCKPKREIKCKQSEKSVEISEDTSAPYPDCCPKFKCVPDPDKVCKDHQGNERPFGETWTEPGCVLIICDPEGRKMHNCAPAPKLEKKCTRFQRIVPIKPDENERAPYPLCCPDYNWRCVFNPLYKILKPKPTQNGKIKFWSPEQNEGRPSLDMLP